jgi:hypothetical protein
MIKNIIDWFKKIYGTYIFRIVLSLILTIILINNVNLHTPYHVLDLVSKYFMETLIPLVVTYLALITAFSMPKGIKEDPITRKAFLKEIYFFLVLTFIIPSYICFFSPDDLFSTSFDSYFDSNEFIFSFIFTFYLLSALRNLHLLYCIHQESLKESIE